jgi:hypothetical protein
MRSSADKSNCSRVKKQIIRKMAVKWWREKVKIRSHVVSECSANKFGQGRRRANEGRAKKE